MRFSLINQPVWGIPILGNPHVCMYVCIYLSIDLSIYLSIYLSIDNIRNKNMLDPEREEKKINCKIITIKQKKLLNDLE